MKKERSILMPWKDEVLALREEGESYRAIAEQLNGRHGLLVSHNAVFKFVQAQEAQPDGLFYEGLPADIRQSLIQQVSSLWTYDSTAIEGNTLTLGETIKVLELGLTISGKPLKDHEEVYGHARAIDLIYDLLARDRVEVEDVFNLHRCVMQKSAIDSLRPVGDWKREYNGTTGLRDGKPVYMEYASPQDTPRLMARWLKEFNRKLNGATSRTKAINLYAWAHLSFVRIHPFFDGNGRVARLLANLPILKGGFPPVLISQEQRVHYIDLLWNYPNQVGSLSAAGRLLPVNEYQVEFKQLVREEWNTAFALVEEAKAVATQRAQGSDDVE